MNVLGIHVKCTRASDPTDTSCCRRNSASSSNEENGEKLAVINHSLHNI